MDFELIEGKSLPFGRVDSNFELSFFVICSIYIRVSF